MPPKRKAKQTTRATPGKAPRHTRLSAALGAPPPPSTSVDFEDAEELQEIVAEVTARSAVHDAGAFSEAVVATSGGPSRVAWEQQVDAHMANTDRLLLEMHGMLQSALSNTRPDVVDPPAPSIAMPVQEQAPVPWPSTSGGRIQGIGGVGRPNSNSSTAPPLACRLEQSVETLLQASLTPASRAHYGRAWNKLVGFHTCIGLQLALPVSVTTILLFVAHLHEQGLAATSITSTLSAISYFHKINSHSDPCNNFIVAKLLAGARNLRPSVDVRLPITIPILSKLIQALPHVIPSPYKRMMLHTMMVLAFKAYLRIGEMVPRSKRSTQGCLHVDDVTVADDMITISFKRFKHIAQQGPQIVHVRGEKIGKTAIHPAALMREYLQTRGRVGVILFAYMDGTPMSRAEFDLALKQLLSFAGLSNQLFKGHSFRIGSASEAAMRGESDAQIRVAGRWSSDAFRKYIRLA